MKSNVIFKSMSTEELKQHLSGLIWAQGELSTMSEFSGDESAAEYANEQAIDEIERILESREGEDLTDEKVGLIKEIDTIKAALVKVGFFDDGDRFTKEAEDATSPVYWSYWPDTLPEAVVAELIAGHIMNPSKSACSVSLETIESAAIVLEWEERLA